MTKAKIETQDERDAEQAAFDEWIGTGADSPRITVRASYLAGWLAGRAWQRRQPRCPHEPTCVTAQRCSERLGE